MVVDEIHKTAIHSSTSNTSQKRHKTAIHSSTSNTSQKQGRRGRDHMIVLQLFM
jgi:hypothetical protein